MIALNGMDAVNPHRPVDWRARHARHLADTGRRPSRHHDSMTAELARFYRGRDVACSRRKSSYGSVDRDLECAVAIHDETNGLGRALIEARLLAGQSPAEIAAKQAITIKAVAWYALLFLDVSGRLDNSDFIAGTVIGPLPTEAHPNAIIGWCLRRAGYHGGVDELEKLLAAAQYSMLRQIITAASTFTDPCDTGGVGQIVQSQLRKLPPEGPGNAQQETLLHAVGLMLNRFKLKVGGREANPSGPLALYDKAGIELSADEQLALAMGEIPKSVPGLEDMEFPELTPRNAEIPSS